MARRPIQGTDRSNFEERERSHPRRTRGFSAWGAEILSLAREMHGIAFASAGVGVSIGETTAQGRVAPWPVSWRRSGDGSGSGRSPSRTGSRGEARRSGPRLTLNRTNRPALRRERFSAGPVREGVAHMRDTLDVSVDVESACGNLPDDCTRAGFRSCPSGAALPVARRAS